MKIIDGKLYVLGDQLTQAVVTRTIELWRQFGFDQVILETRWASLDPKALRELGLDWDYSAPERPTTQPIGARDGDATDTHSTELNGTYASLPGVVHDALEPDLPVLVSKLDQSQWEAFRNQCKSNPAFSLRQAPTTMAFSGQLATIQDVCRRPFVVAVRRIDRSIPDIAGNFQPEFQIVPDGDTIHFKATVKSQQMIQLDCEILKSRVSAVNEVNLPFDVNGDPVTVQNPVVTKFKVATKQWLKNNQTLAILTGQTERDGKKFSEVMLVTCRILKFHQNVNHADGNRPISNTAPIENTPLPGVPFLRHLPAAPQVKTNSPAGPIRN